MADALAEPPSAPEASAGGAPEATAPPTDDSVIIHPHLFDPKPKPVAAVQFSKQLLKHLGSGGDKAGAKAFAARLDQARSALAGALDSPALSESSVQSALADYLGLLLGLVDAPAKVEGAAEASAAAAEAAEAGQPQPQQGLRGNSPLRRAVSFVWSDALVGSGTGTYPDAVFELASVLVAAGIWHMRRAAELCRDSASGVSTPASVQANKLLRAAAGMLDYVVTWVLPLLSAGVSEDCSPQLVKGLSLLCLADCQMLTVLRAVQRGNQPSLIAGIAGDTAALYGSALQTVLGGTVPAAAGSKLAAYLRYKQASLQAYAHCFAGIAQWKAEQAGAGLRCVQEGQASSDAAKKLYLDFDKAPPATLTNAHRRYDEILQAVLVDTKQRIEKENAVVFLQKVPPQLPEAPAPKRLVAPAAFALPPLAPGAKEGVLSFGAIPGAAAAAAAVEMQPSPVQGPPAAGAPAAAGAPPPAQPAAAAEGGGCSCWRWLLFLIAMPLMLLVSAVGIVIWVVLLPVKILCCPCGCLVQLLADVVELLVKAPLKLVLWTTGKPWEAGGREGGRKQGDSAV